MAPGLFSTAGPYHILAYGTLLGSEVFNSFVAGIVSFTVLPRSHFGQLQKALFPIYFGMQTGLPLLMALTFPADRLSIRGSFAQGGIRGMLEDEHRWSVTVPLALVFFTSAVNLVSVGPMSTKVMVERKHQETRDGKRYHDPGPQSERMQELNKRFSFLHSVSSLLNVVGCVATVWYGFYLGERLY